MMTSSGDYEGDVADDEGNNDRADAAWNDNEKDDADADNGDGNAGNGGAGNGADHVEIEDDGAKYDKHDNDNDDETSEDGDNGDVNHLC